MHHIKFNGKNPAYPDEPMGPQEVLGIGVFKVGEVKELTEEQAHYVMLSGEPFYERANKADFEKWQKSQEKQEAKIDAAGVTITEEGIEPNPIKGKGKTK